MPPGPFPSFPPLTATSTSTPSNGISSQATNNKLDIANITTLDENVLSAHHDLFLPPPVAPVSSACAACKYQRRKCGPQCMLAPYFPPERHNDFQNAHKLFGVSNIVKKLRQLEPADRQKAVDSMIFEANMHAKDPAGGCLQILLNLKTQINELHEELIVTQTQLSYFRQDHANSDASPQEQPYADQPGLNNLLLKDANLTQNNVQNHAHEQQLQTLMYLSSNPTDEKSDDDGDIESRHMTCDYVHNFHYQNEVEHKAGASEPRPIAENDHEGGEHPVCKSGVDMTSLDKPTQYDLGLALLDYSLSNVK